MSHNRVYYDKTSILYQSVRKELNHEEWTSYELGLYIIPPSDTAPFNALGFDFEFPVLGVPVAIGFEFPVICDLSDILASQVAAFIKQLAEQATATLKPQLEKQNEAR